MVCTLPAQVANLAWQTTVVVSDLLFRAASEALMIIAGDTYHLGARIGITAVLHTFGSAIGSGQGAASTYLPPALRRIPRISRAGVEGDGRVRGMSVHRIDHPLEQQKGALRHTELGSYYHAIVRAVCELVL